MSARCQTYQRSSTTFINGGLDCERREYQSKACHDEAASLLLDDAPLIWWFTENALEAVTSEVKGYAPSFSERHTALKTAWLIR